MLQYARKNPDLMKCLRDEAHWNHLDKKWICDVLYTKDSAGITELINQALKN